MQPENDDMEEPPINGANSDGGLRKIYWWEHSVDEFVTREVQAEHESVKFRKSMAVR